MRMHNVVGRRALSVTASAWQLRAAAMLGVLFAGGPAAAVDNGDVGTLEVGRYACEAPDPQDVERGELLPLTDFAIVNSSSYRAEGVVGSYLRIGDQVTFTSGRREGDRFRVIARASLQALTAQGQDSRMRCVMVKRNTR
jgi:hypothetical protein